MKKYVVFLLMMLISFSLLEAQLPEDDPLSESYIIHRGGGDELVTFDQSYGIDIYKFYKALEYYNHDTLIKTLSWNGLVGYPYSYDIDLGDLDNDELEEIVATWVNSSQVEIVVLKADPARLIVDSISAWDKIIRLTKTTPAVYEPQNWQLLPGIFVRTANLDSDPFGEFVVAYWATDGMVEITAYDVDDTLAVTELGTFHDQQIQEPPEISLCEDQVYLYDIECADFNGDSIDEILLTGRMAYDPAGWQIFANVYAYNESSGNLEARIKDTIYTQTKSYVDIGNFNTASGKFHSANSEDAVIGFFQYNTTYISGAKDTIANILIPVEMNAQLNVMTVGEPINQRLDTIPWACYYNRTSTLYPSDVNNDGLDELLSAFSFERKLPIFKIYQGDQPLTFSVYADLDHFADEFYTTIPVGNFYKDTVEDLQPVEIFITTEESYAKYNTEIYQIKTKLDGSFDKLELKYGYSGDYTTLLPGGKTEPLIAGNVDGDIRLGKPKHYSATEILQPLVILNAPPIHFDVFDNQSYDVCRSYNENTGEFVASYTKESEQSTEVRTEMNKDWSMSYTLSTEFSGWGLSVSAHLSEKYGKKFSKVEGSSRTVTVGFAIDATVDDQIYATVMDYDIWEYPVYGNDKFKGNVLVVEPQIVKNSWFDSKSWKGYTYIPNHEVGNILSYRRYPLLSDNPMLREKIKGDYGLETSFLLSGNSSYNWYLSFTDFTEAQATTTNEYSRDWGVSVSYWGAGFSMEGSYSSEDIQTQRTTVQSGINMNVHLDAVDMSLGETRYDVTPYAYWASNGALVIDYAVAPEVSGPGGEDTWWDTHYGYLADPAFILPWRYDPEKGNAISEAKRYQTKDIVFKPEDPKEGDILTIYAQVHNFSLIPTPNPMGVRFYVGDPDNGGTLIVGEGDVSEVFTDGPIPSRGTMQVEMKWKIPEDLSSFPRIYAVIDADKILPEIHENNNKSWNILMKTTGEPSSYEVIDDFPGKFVLEQNYPNPFSHSTWIKFSVPGIQQVIIEVYNLYGQKIETLVNKPMIAGSYEVEFNGNNKPSGIYLCRIKAGEFQQVIKMALFK